MKKLTLTLMAMSIMVTMSACGNGGNSDVQPKESSSPAKAKMVVLEESLQAEEYAIGFKKDNTAVTDAVMSAFDILQDEGKIAEISNKWFGKDIVLKATDKKYDTLVKLPQGQTTLVMGLDDSFPPMGFRDEKNEIVGFDVDVAKAVCEKLGVELVLQPIDWASKELELNNGFIDCIWNGMSITPERIENMLLSRAYLANNQVVVVLDTANVKTKADLKGKKIAVQTGSSAENALEKDAISKEIGEKLQYADNVTALQDLKTGRIDAVILDEVVARYYTEIENAK